MRCGTQVGMAKKFRRIDRQRKKEPLIKDFLHSPLAFDVSRHVRTWARYARFSRTSRSRVPRARSTSKEFSSRLGAPPFDQGSSSLFSYTPFTRAPHIVERLTFATGRSFYSEELCRNDFRLVSRLPTRARSMGDNQTFRKIKKKNSISRISLISYNVLLCSSILKIIKTLVFKNALRTEVHHIFLYLYVC